MSNLDILFIKDGDRWVAQCLQYDIAAQGDTIPEAKNAFEYAFATEMAYLVETERSLDDLDSAPVHLWNIYRNQSSALEPIPAQPVRFPANVAAFLKNLIPEQTSLRVA